MSVAQPILSPSEISASTPAAAAAAAMTAERFARLQLARSQNVGPRTFGQLLRRYGSARSALDALPYLAARGGKSDYVACDPAEVEAEIATGNAAGAQLLLLGDPDYPPMLQSLDPAPPLVWARGDTGLLTRRSVAIVGARNASALGLRTARRLARELGSMGHVVVSGLARGIDAAAHEASLGTGTSSITGDNWRSTRG